VFTLPLADWRQGKEGEIYIQIGDVMLGDRNVDCSHSAQRVSKYLEDTEKSSQKTRNYSRCPKLPGPNKKLFQSGGCKYSKVFNNDRQY
jgi:hypothetical protein